MFKLNVANRIYFKFAVYPNGFVAQWITRLPTEQKIPGSTPGRLDPFFLSKLFQLSNCDAVRMVHFI